MNKIIYIILFIMAFSIAAYAQTPVIIWSTSHDGGADDGAYGLSIDSQENIYVTGRVLNGVGDQDSFLMKLNSSGIVQWTNQFDYLGGNELDDSDDVFVAPNGSIYQVGFATDGAFYYYGMTREFDSAGNVILETNFPFSSIEFHGIEVDNAGNKYIAGSYSAGAGDWQGLVVKLSNNYAQAWNRLYNHNANSDDFRRVAVDPTGTYIYVVGSQHNGGTDYDLVLVRYDPITADIMWTNIYNTVGTGFENGTAVVCDASGNVYVTGMYVNGVIMIRTMKYNSSGALQWARDLLLANNTGGHGITLDNAGNVYVVGDITIGANDGWLMLKYNSAGSNIWMKTKMGTGANILRDIAVAGNGDGNIYVAGEWNNGTDQDFITAMFRQMPFSPTGLSASLVSTTTIKLSWGDASSSENGYIIYRSTDGTNFVALTTVGSGSTSYNDATCTLNTPYWYKVAAVNEAGEADSSTITRTITQAGLDAAADDGGIEIVAEQDGETDVIIGRNKIYTSKEETVYFYFFKKAEVVIYSIDGREIDRFKGSALSYEEWGEDDTVPGVYVASITVDGRDDIVVRKILVLR